MTRLRDLGIRIGDTPPGQHNAITDVPGIRVGHTTLWEDDDVRTGVTAIIPPVLPVPAGLCVGNGYGKLIGATQLVELGEIETPILLTGTLSAFKVADALITWMLEQPDFAERRSLNPVIGETNDGTLSDIRSRPITPEHVFQALDRASDGPVEEGCVGAGTGTIALGFKAGIGTSSRVIGSSVVGVLVQANFGGTLTIQGRRIPAPAAPEPGGNSCMIIVATDAALDARQLTRVATRAVFAMGRVGASYSHGSGDYGIAVSLRNDRTLADSELDPLFSATQDAVEEALLNSLVAARTTHGYGGEVRHAVSHQLLRSATG